MPKRSNEFQRLVYFVQKAVVDGASAEESALLTDLATGADREVDVCIRGSVGGHDVLISIECRDHKRRADVGWVEQMAAKHQRLTTNALILASKSGFSSNALKVAKHYNARTISFDQIEETDFGSLLGASSNLWAKKVIASAEKVVFVVRKQCDSKTERVAVSRDNYLHTADGEVVGLAEELVGRLLRSPQVREYLLLHGDTEHTYFTLEWDVKKAKIPDQIFLKSLDPEELRVIESVDIRGPCKIEIENFAVKQAEIDEVTVAWGEPKILGNDAILISIQDPQGKESIALRVDGEEIQVKKPTDD